MHLYEGWADAVITVIWAAKEGRETGWMSKFEGNERREGAGCESKLTS